jgi:hypothetical protein
MSAPAQADIIEIDDSVDIICNKVSFQCPMCKDYFDGSAGMILRDCLHIFCFECVAKYIINNSVLGSGAPIKCLHAEIPSCSTSAGCYGVFQVKSSFICVITRKLYRLIPGKGSTAFFKFVCFKATL